MKVLEEALGAVAEAINHQRGINSLDNTGQLLCALVEAVEPISLGALAKAAGMAPAKAFPHLVSLQKIGLVERDSSGNFIPGPLSLELGLTALQRLSPTREAEVEVVSLAQATGLSVAVSVFGTLGPTVVRLEESSRPQHVSLRVGTVLSMVNTAIGRVCAAFIPADMLSEALSMDSIRMAGAPADFYAKKDGSLKLEFQARLGQIRSLQMDQAISWPVPGISTLAAPVFNHTGQLAVVLAVMGSSGSFDATLDGETAKLLRGATANISWRLGASL
jgi:DNA-binding IclR family transcriptional regulator